MLLLPTAASRAIQPTTAVVYTTATGALIVDNSAITENVGDGIGNAFAATSIITNSTIDRNVGFSGGASNIEGRL